MGQINLKIVTPEGVFINEPVDIVTVRTIMGDIGILHNHIPFVSTIVPSKMTYRIDGKLNILHVSGGIIQTSQEYVKIISDKVETDEMRTSKMQKAKTTIIK